MISAKEAREQINLFETRRNENQIDMCEKAIKRSIDSGKSTTYLDISLTISVKTYLEHLGYKVEYSSRCNENECSTTISW
jgi:hypothetical protein